MHTILVVECFSLCLFCFLFCLFSSIRRHTRCALVTGVQTCALPICFILSGKFQIMSPPYLKAFINTGGVNPSRDVISNEADSNGNRWGFRQMDIAITKYIPFKFLSEESRLRLRVDILDRKSVV